MSALNSATQHPKELLYAEVYDPLVMVWFDQLRSAMAVELLLCEAPTRDVVDNLERLDALFHELVDSDAVRAAATSERISQTVTTHRDHMLWEDQMAPGPDAGPAEVMASFRHKLKRNISLAALEAVICLHSALRYARQELHLGGDELEATLRRSTVLAASLAALHDEREKVRMQYLTGSTEEIMYPAVGFADVVAGRFAIGADMFTTVGLKGQLKIRFRRSPQDKLTLPSPTMMCPAQRLDDARGEPLNNYFWGLLVDVYKFSGELH
jgi:hypothetical protein